MARRGRGRVVGLGLERVFVLLGEPLCDIPGALEADDINPGCGSVSRVPRPAEPDATGAIWTRGSLTLAFSLLCSVAMILLIFSLSVKCRNHGNRNPFAACPKSVNIIIPSDLPLSSKR